MIISSSSMSGIAQPGNVEREHLSYQEDWKVAA